MAEATAGNLTTMLKPGLISENQPYEMFLSLLSVNPRKRQ